MPEISVWPVSSLVRTWKVGSSSARRPSATRHLLLVDLRLGLDRDLDDGLGEDDVLEVDRRVGGGERVAGDDLLDAHRGGDVAGVDLVDLLAVVGVHHQDAPDPLGAAGVDVEHARAGLEVAGVDAEVGELADVGVGHDLEGERRERLGVVGVAGDLALAAPRPDQFGAGHRRARRAARAGSRSTASSSGCTPLFLKEEPHSTGVSLVESVALRIACLSALLGDLGLLEDQLQQLVVVVGDLLEQVLARGRGGVGQLGGDLDFVLLLAELVLVDDRLHRDEVDDALEVALGADRQLDRHGVGAEAVDHRLHALLEVGADAVHLVDVGDARDVVLVGLAPDGLRLGLDAGDGVEQRDRAVEHAQRALDLDGEVDVAGRVDDVDAVVLPLRGGGGGGDRDAALLLLFHPVHRGRALVDLADLVGAAGVVEDALGRRRLAGVDVRHDPDVAGVFESELAWHGSGSWWLWMWWSRRAGKKMGPSGPRALLVCAGPVRVVICSRSPSSISVLRGGPLARHAPRPRRAADYSRGILGGLRRRWRRVDGPRALDPAAGARGSSKTAPRRSSTVWRRAARGSRRRRAPPPSARARAARLASTCALPCGVSRETTTRRSLSERARSTWPESASASSIWVTVAGVSRAASASSPAESSPRSCELDQQLELGVADLGAARGGCRGRACG